MLTFHKIKWKNLLSTGNVFTEIPLDQDSNALIIGENGSGKSTILDALTFVLFGKAFRRINKPALINSINEKGLVVEITFDTNGKSYHIIRGMKPNIFEIYCNGILLNQDATSRDYQNYLETFVLKMNYKSFTQIVILGSASFTPFMQLTAADRRAVIEDLLDIQVFSVMNVIVRQRLQENRESIERNRIEISVKSEKLSFIEKTLASLQLNTEEKRSNLAIRYADELNFQEELISLDNDYKYNIELLLEKSMDTSKVRDRYKKLIGLQSKIEQNRDRAEKDIAFFANNATCPTCTQPINEHFRRDKTSELTVKCEGFVSGLDQMSVEIEKTLGSIKEMEATMQEYNDLVKEQELNRARLANVNRKIAEIEEELEQLNKSDTTYTESQAEYEKVLGEIEALEKTRENLVNERQFIDTAIVLLKDGGIKTKIIKQYLPIINKLINKYLAAMGFFANFEINENFEESIKSRHIDDFSYYSFSEGEKMRIDLAVLFTWRSIAKMRNSVNTNLLILDEIFDSSLDSNGTDEFLKIMWGLVQDTNCFVISHKTDVLQDRFQKLYRFEKVKNFSRVVP
jgi:DNA repair exonuclease SbcCD ATPase subunit